MFDRDLSKRLFDLMLVVPSLLMLSPLLMVLVVLIRIQLGSPVFFTQMRPGRHGRPFWILKFRTMNNLKDSNGVLLPDADRLASFGRFLRSSSLDELPELINVLKGEMSFVGPRPLLLEYIDRYTPQQSRRHEVQPGITGWAQINGRNSLSWEKKFELDVWYVDNQSLWLDIRIIFLTFWKILKRENISQEGQATMSKFMGTKQDV